MLDSPMVLTDIHTLNQNWVHVNGLGPWSDHIDLSAPESSQTYGSRISLDLEGQSGSMLISHSGTGFIGIFRPEGMSIDIVYPPQTTFSAQEKALPVSDEPGTQAMVQPNDIIFFLLPRQFGWQGIKPVDLQGAMMGVDGGDQEQFTDFVKNLPRIITDYDVCMLVCVVSKRPKGLCSACKVMHSPSEQEDFPQITPSQSGIFGWTGQRRVNRQAAPTVRQAAPGIFVLDEASREHAEAARQRAQQLMAQARANRPVVPETPSFEADEDEDESGRRTPPPIFRLFGRDHSNSPPRPQRERDAIDEIFRPLRHRPTYSSSPSRSPPRSPQRHLSLSNSSSSSWSESAGDYDLRPRNSSDERSSNDSAPHYSPLRFSTSDSSDELMTPEQNQEADPRLQHQLNQPTPQVRLHCPPRIRPEPSQESATPRQVNQMPSARRSLFAPRPMPSQGAARTQPSQSTGPIPSQLQERARGPTIRLRMPFSPPRVRTMNVAPRHIHLESSSSSASSLDSGSSSSSSSSDHVPAQATRRRGRDEEAQSPRSQAGVPPKKRRIK